MKAKVDLSSIDPNDPKQVKNFADKHIDFSKGMFGQLVYLEKLYQSIVHIPYLKPIYMFHHESFFESPRKRLLELTSSIPWFVIPLVWLPWITMEMYLSQQWYGNALPVALKVFLFCFGTFFCWPTFEYVLHRFVFHFMTEHWILNAGHYMIHGVHHLVPKDLNRSVFPPIPCFVFMVAPMHIAGYIATNLISRFFDIAFPVVAQFAITLFCGFLFGYVTYDCVHWYYHAGNADGWLYNLPLVGSYFLYLKQCHMQHHFVRGGENFNFGLTPIAKILYDGLFGTSLEPDVTEQEIQRMLNKKTN